MSGMSTSLSSELGRGALMWLDVVLPGRVAQAFDCGTCVLLT
jgi:hypothetical protein